MSLASVSFLVPHRHTLHHMEWLAEMTHREQNNNRTLAEGSSRKFEFKNHMP